MKLDGLVKIGKRHEKICEEMKEKEEGEEDWLLLDSDAWHQQGGGRESKKSGQRIVAKLAMEESAH
jgi:hypothetical protein